MTRQSGSQKMKFRNNLQFPFCCYGKKITMSKSRFGGKGLFDFSRLPGHSLSLSVVWTETQEGTWAETMEECYFLAQPQAPILLAFICNPWLSVRYGTTHNGLGPPEPINHYNPHRCTPGKTDPGHPSDKAFLFRWPYIVPSWPSKLARTHLNSRLFPLQYCNRYCKKKKNSLVKLIPGDK